MSNVVREGLPFPRGATVYESGVNFALFSANATSVELCLFDASGRKELERIVLPEHTDEIWHGFVEGLEPGQVYGYRVNGPYAPHDGHRFNANKLLLDPYARAYVGEMQWNDACFGYVVGHEDGDLSFDERDSAPFVPKSVVVDPNFAWDGEGKCAVVPVDRTVLYELHVKGFTKQRGDLPENVRGTYAGLGRPEIVDYVKSLGVTSVELLPIHAFLDDGMLVDQGLVNYWGYNTMGFFAPAPRYASDPSRSLAEFKEMVARYHAAGLEIILDVVYNHTAEGNEMGPTLSFKGIDNASYYRLVPDDKRYYINETGTGNTFNVSNRRVTQFVLDSLRYWVNDMHVDGFRFDLGTVLARDPSGFQSDSAFLIAASQDPTLTNVKLIAEPWDVGPGGYQVGAFPPGWLEWNDAFRDTVRDFWRGEASAAALATRLTASPDKFDHDGRKPWASVNFITAHDGFTLGDLVSYNEKHNEKNGEDNRDGSDSNRSWNSGAEGPSDDAEIQALRGRRMRDLLATLLLSQGTPMLQGGDEFGRSQDGNNNVYAQDGPISWIDWDVSDVGKTQIEFVRTMTALRAKYPILRFTRFLTGRYDEEFGVKDLTWINASGHEMQQADWDNDETRCFGMLLDGRAQKTGVRVRGIDATILLVFNGYHDVVNFVLPDTAEAKLWQRLFDTNVPDEDPASLDVGASYAVTGRSMLGFVLEAKK